MCFVLLEKTTLVVHWSQSTLRVTTHQGLHKDEKQLLHVSCHTFYFNVHYAILTDIITYTSVFWEIILTTSFIINWFQCLDHKDDMKTQIETPLPNPNVVLNICIHRPYMPRPHTKVSTQASENC